MDFISSVKHRYQILAAKKELDQLLLSHAAYKAVLRLDEKYVGTDNYMGLAWFWNHVYTDYLRPENCTVRKRVAVHDALIAAELGLKEESKAHEKIIKSLTR